MAENGGFFKSAFIKGLLLNSAAWSSILARLLLNFGCTAYIAISYTAAAVSAWVLLNTALAVVNTADSLLSQYYLRRFIFLKENVDARQAICREQSFFYFLASLISVLSGLIFVICGASLSAFVCFLLFALYIGLKKNDSRARATGRILEFQVIEASAFICCALTALFCIYMRMEVMTVSAVVITVMCAQLLVKQWLLVPDHFRSHSGVLGKIRVSSELSDVLLLSSTGAFSVNLALLTIAAFVSSESVTALLFTFRCLMLVCEIAFTPLVARMPLITQQLSSLGRDAAWRLFSRQRVFSFGLLVAGFFSFWLLWDRFSPLVGDNLVTLVGASYFIACASWGLERHISSVVQFQISCRKYDVKAILKWYPIALGANVVVTVISGNVVIFLLGLFSINAITAVLVSRKNENC